MGIYNINRRSTELVEPPVYYRLSSHTRRKHVKFRKKLILHIRMMTLIYTDETHFEFEVSNGYATFNCVFEVLSFVDKYMEKLWKT